jgi:hypothetical protein
MAPKITWAEDIADCDACGDRLPSIDIMCGQTDQIFPGGYLVAWSPDVTDCTLPPTGGPLFECSVLGEPTEVIYNAPGPACQQRFQQRGIPNAYFGYQPPTEFERYTWSKALPSGEICGSSPRFRGIGVCIETCNFASVRIQVSYMFEEPAAGGNPRVQTYLTWSQQPTENITDFRRRFHFNSGIAVPSLNGEPGCYNPPDRLPSLTLLPI